MVVVWSPQAKEDLEGIWEYYSSKNIRAAVKMINGIRSAVLLLEANPHIGSVEQQLNHRAEQFRSVVVMKNHKVVYYIDGDKVYLVLIWDCRRNPKTLRKIVGER
jgi:plasmid stabilization system protein ParE